MSTQDLRTAATELTERIKAFEARILKLGGYCRCVIDIDSTHKLTFERHKSSWALIIITPTTDYLLRDASLELKILCAPKMSEIIPAIIEAQRVLISRLHKANSTLATTFSELDIPFPPPPTA